MTGWFTGDDIASPPARPINPAVPRVARVYKALHEDDKDAFESERDARDEILRLLPDAGERARQMTYFARQAAITALRRGIRQIVDIGAGSPTKPSLLQTVTDLAPDARVWQIDRDPIVLAHLRAEPLAPTATIIDADARDPQLLEKLTKAGLDLTQPVGVLLAAVLHFVTDTDCGGLGPAAITQTLRDCLVDGSVLAISHVCATGSDSAVVAGLTRLYQYTDACITWRTEEHIQEFFTGFTLLPPPGLPRPGLADVAQWQPSSTGPQRLETGSSAVRILAGIGYRDHTNSHHCSKARHD